MKISLASVVINYLKRVQTSDKLNRNNYKRIYVFMKIICIK